MIKPTVKVKKKPIDGIKRLEAMNKQFAKQDRALVGLPKESNPYPDGTSVIMVGAVHEFGSPANGVPERSFLRSTIMENRKKYRKFLVIQAKKILQGKTTEAEALEKLGFIVQQDVQQKIYDIDSPGLLHREGNPLVDTAHLVESITYIVEKAA